MCFIKEDVLNLNRRKLPGLLLNLIGLGALLKNKSCKPTQD